MNDAMEAKVDRINVRIDGHLKQELEAEARERGMSPSEVVRDVLAAHVKSRPRQQNCLDLAREIGLIGCARGLPADLSTNREHFDHFGRG
jgi:metal-responsive CopG/Arc/MetJ family transcriptional regulator